MDIIKAKQEFIEYTNKYDVENENIARKISHSLRVMEISGQIAKNLLLNDEQIKLAKIVGLLHDIARFEQWKRYGTYKDVISIDHGDLGVEVLKQDNMIRKFINEDKYDKVILSAIKNHNKYKIEDNLTSEELLFSKIVRDADKLDLMYIGVEKFWKQRKEIEEVEESMISTEVYNEFVNMETINNIFNKTPADAVVAFIAFIYDINFKYSFTLFKTEDYINKIMDKFKFKNTEVKEKFDNIREIANEYIENMIKDDIN